MAENNNRRGNNRNEGKQDSRGVKILRTVDKGASAVKGVVQIVEFAMAMGKVLKNHPQWLTHTAALPTGLNYGLDKAYPITGGWQKPKEFAMSTPQLMVQHLGLCTAVSNDIQQKYSAQMGYIRDTLVGASGRLPYSTAEVAYYIENVRVAYAMLASLTRAWQCTFASDPNDANLRRTLLMGNYIAADDDNVELPGSVRDQIAAFWSRLASFPIVGDIFDSTIHTFSNIFMDSTDDKPTYIMNLPYRPRMRDKATGELEALPTFTGWVTTLGPTLPPVNAAFDAMIADVSSALNFLESEYSEDAIRADFKRVYGMSKAVSLCDNQRILTNPIPAPTAVYDEYLLRQIQNSVSLSWVYRVAGGKVYDSSIVERYDGIYKWFESGVTFAQADNIPNVPDDSDFGDNWKYPVINGGGIPLDDVGKQLSMTRLVFTGHMEKVGDYSHNLRIDSCGSDIVCGRWFLMYSMSRISETNSRRKPTFARVPSIFLSSTDFPADEFSGLAALASTRYAPSFIFLRGLGGGGFYTNRFFDAGDFAILSPDLVASRHSITCQSLYWAEPSLKKTTANTK